MIGRHRQSRPASRPGPCSVPALAAACALALAPVIAPSLPDAGPASPDPGSSSASSVSVPADTIPVGPTSEVYGRVVEQDGGDGIGQADLLFHRLIEDSVIDSFSTTTSDDGAFHFEHLPSGTYALATEHLGFETRRDSFRVPVSKSVRIEIPLVADPVEMSPLEVTVRAGWLVETGFYRRRSKSFGRFITPGELERRHLNTLTQALKTVPGVEYGRRCTRGHCREAIRMSLSAGRSACPVTYYMDGDEMHGPVSPKDIAVQDLAAIEIYRGISETPPQFYGRCGSVVMWSKRSGS